MSNTNDDHAQVGALLARCEHLEIRKLNIDWIAWVRLKVGGLLFAKTGPTQLAAIRAAVEAAEQGVRE